jgi:hypothetical protein
MEAAKKLSGANGRVCRFQDIPGQSKQTAALELCDRVHDREAFCAVGALRHPHDQLLGRQMVWVQSHDLIENHAFDPQVLLF